MVGPTVAFISRICTPKEFSTSTIRCLFAISSSRSICGLLSLSYFFSKEAFSLSAEALSNREIRFDHLTADLRFSDIAIWKDLQAHKQVKGNIFNYSRKLV